MNQPMRAFLFVYEHRRLFGVRSLFHVSLLDHNSGEAMNLFVTKTSSNSIYQKHI